MSLFNNDRDILDIYDDEDDGNYRERGLQNAQSNNGWYKCIKCGRSFRKGDMHIDHIIPKSLGGGNNRGNLQCICKYCNCSKRDDMTDTGADLRRRKKELNKQNKEDLKYLKQVRKIRKNME